MMDVGCEEIDGREKKRKRLTVDPRSVARNSLTVSSATRVAAVIG